METRIKPLIKGKRIALDTMIFIYHLENHPEYKIATTEILQAIEQGETQGITSTITLLELLVKPLQTENIAAAENYRFVLTTFPNLKLSEVSIKIAEKAAEVRARYSITTPDSIQLATAIVEQSDLFITNDQSLKNFIEIPILTLDQII